ncbi:sigma-70 family RNA polymerase sigma factor [Lujinxingia vulgaris]|uniref:Sigma-70 family RNA polymerase sigma factor n=2 Tax=Lujinxingia vulgaris TaxID=2600176 RepID=A0A5C6X2S6_9DELT|nr:sigma-70 family RNA polymerase sigma factor [Lujinxingia vulgaris]
MRQPDALRRSSRIPDAMIQTSQAKATRDITGPLPDNTLELIRRFQKLVYKIAHQVHQSTGEELSFDDLVSWGFTGLLAAYERFDPEINSRFLTYAYYRIRGAMLDACRRHAQVVTQQSIYEQAANEVMQAYSHVVYVSRQERSIEERMDLLGDIAGELNLVYVLSQPPEQALRGRQTPALDAMEREQARQLVRELVAGLGDRERRLIEGFYFEKRTLSELAEELGYSISWASRAHVRVLKALRAKVEGESQFESLGPQV